MNKQLSYLEAVKLHNGVVRYYRKEALIEAIINVIGFYVLDSICCFIARKPILSYEELITGIIILVIMLIILQCFASCTISREDKLIDTLNVADITISDRCIVQDSNFKSTYKIVGTCDGVKDTYEVREWEYGSCKIGDTVKLFVK